MIVDHRPAAGLPSLESGVALRFPPHSKMRVRVSGGIFGPIAYLLVILLCVIVALVMVDMEEHYDYACFDFQFQHAAAS